LLLRFRRVMKELVAQAIAARVKNGEVIGLGSGSTVELALLEIKKRVQREGLQISGVPTSHRTAILAKEAGVTVLSPMLVQTIAWAFDGADEVDPNLDLIKGHGGAMLNEKIIASIAERFVVIITEDKQVKKLGEKFPVPVEVIPEALTLVEKELLQLGASKVVLRQAAGKYGPVITEHNNLILDASFPSISPAHESKIKCIPGVVENGLFMGYADEILVATASGKIQTLNAH